MRTARDGHIVVIGSSSTAVRLVEELERAGEQVEVLAVGPKASAVVDDMAEMGAQVHHVAHVREPELLRVHIKKARAAVIVGFDDVSAITAALAIDELNSAARLVLELSNPNLAGRIQSLLGECVVLSSAELAAPSFAAAADRGGDVKTFEIGGRLVAAGDRHRVGGDILAVLGDTAQADDRGVLPAQGDLVLGTHAIESKRKHVRRAGWLGAFASVFDKRLRVVVATLLALMLISVLYFRFVADVEWTMAIYLALTAATLTGLGDYELPLAARFGGVIIQLFGVVLSSGITAVIVDALISARIGELTGGLRGKPRKHAVICGLGRIGTSVMLYLRSQGVPVVAIERSEDAPGVARARAAKVPVIVADSANLASLQQAGVENAESVLAVTDDDAVNLEIALVAKHAQPDVRVVTRLFDHELAGRVEKRLNVGPTRSVSMVAAPAFAAAALGRPKEVVFSVGRRVLIFTELTVRPDSEATGLSPLDLNLPEQVRVLAHRPVDSNWSWSPSPHQLSAGDKVAVAATRTGLAALLVVLQHPASFQEPQIPGQRGLPTPSMRFGAPMLSERRKDG